MGTGESVMGCQAGGLLMTDEELKRDQMKLPEKPLFDGEPGHCSLCSEPGHTHDDHWLFQHELVQRLQARIQDLEQQLGILHESDGSEARLGVTTIRLAELRELASESFSGQLVTVGALQDALRFYDLVRKAWEGSIEEYNELKTACGGND